MKAVRVVVIASFCLAFVAISFAANGNPPNALPGAEIDLRTATALADQIVVGKISRVGPSRFLSWQSGMQYEDVAVDIEQSLKGEPMSRVICFVGTPDQTIEGKKLPPQHLPASGRYIFFVSQQPHVDEVPHGFKLEPATAEAIEQIKGYSSQLPTTRQFERGISQAATRLNDLTISDLTAEIILPDPIPSGHSLWAKLRLTNHSDVPIRICTLGQCWRSFDAHGRNSDTNLTPGEFKSDTPALVEFAKCVKTIDPEKSFDIPIDFAVEDDHGNVRLTARYTVTADIARKLDIWAGSVRSDPVTANR